LDKINGELELARKKKQALDKLFDEGRVSQLTYDSFSNEVAQAIAEIEAKQNALVEKMKAKVSELEQQLKTLEFLLVNSEIRHVSGEMDEEAYNRECNVLSLGLETTRRELNEVKDAISNLSEKNIDLPPLTPPEAEKAEQVEAEPEPEPETEKRLEIVMDTETTTTTSIETAVEEQPAIEEKTETPTEQVSEQEKDVEVSFRPEEPQSEEKPDSQEASSGEETTQAQD
jgi:hypothetical protein